MYSLCRVRVGVCATMTFGVSVALQTHRGRAGKFHVNETTRNILLDVVLAQEKRTCTSTTNMHQ